MSKLYEKGDVHWLKAKYYNLFTTCIHQCNTSVEIDRFYEWNGADFIISDNNLFKRAALWNVVAA